MIKRVDHIIIRTPDPRKTSKEIADIIIDVTGNDEVEVAREILGEVS